MARNPASAHLLGVIVLSALCACASGRNELGRKVHQRLLFDRGKAHCRIVSPAEPEEEERLAAELLQDVFESIGGVKVGIENEEAQPDPNLLNLHVGRTALALERGRLPADLDADGFVIRSGGPRDVVLLGARSVSTFYAVTEFLERYAGVLWVWPGEHGTVLPKTETLSVELRDQVSAPAFRARRFSGMGKAEMRLYRIHQVRREVRSEFHHNIWRVMKPRDYWEEHPEYFALVDGRRVKPVHYGANWQACTSNPGVVRVFSAAARAQFEREPWVASFSVSQNDGRGFCTCRDCVSLDLPGEAGISDRYFTFQNAVADAVAESHPDKCVCCLAYGVATRDLPKRITLRPNTMIYAVIPTLIGVRDRIRDWSEAAPNLGVYFWMHGKPVPKFYPHRLAEFLKFLLGHKVREVYAEVYQASERFLSSFEVDGPRVWMTAKLLWDPYADVDALMDMFCTRFHGRAKAPMLRYYRQCELAWERRPNPEDFGRDCHGLNLEIYTTDDVDLMEACIAEALQLVDAGPERERLKLLHGEFAETAQAVRQNDLRRVLETMPVTDADAADAALDLVSRREQQAVSMEAQGSPLFEAVSPSRETVIDARFDAISAALGPGAPEYWRTRMKTHPAIARFIETQVKLPPGGLPNLAANPGFEKSGKGEAGPDPALRWDPFDAPGWSKWLRPNAPGSVRTDDSTARSGSRSLRIEGCIAACALQKRKVRPGERYRIFCWAKTTTARTEDKPAGALTIKWTNDADKWLGRPPPVKDELAAGERDWTRLGCVLTVPPRAGHLVMMLGAMDQAPGDKVWFDDFRVEKMREAPEEGE